MTWGSFLGLTEGSLIEDTGQKISIRYFISNAFADLRKMYM